MRDPVVWVKAVCFCETCAGVGFACRACSLLSNSLFIFMCIGEWWVVEGKPHHGPQLAAMSRSFGNQVVRAGSYICWCVATWS